MAPKKDKIKEKTKFFLHERNEHFYKLPLDIQKELDRLAARDAKQNFFEADLIKMIDVPDIECWDFGYELDIGDIFLITKYNPDTEMYVVFDLKRKTKHDFEKMMVDGYFKKARKPK